MSRLHRQKLRARARAEHPQLTRGDVAAVATEKVDPLVRDLVGMTKPARKKRARRKAVRKSKAKAKHK